MGALNLNDREQRLLWTQGHTHDLILRCVSFEAAFPKAYAYEPAFKQLKEVTKQLKKIFNDLEWQINVQSLSSVAPQATRTA
jgi:hypothetical protein